MSDEDQGQEVPISVDFTGPYTLNEIVEIEAICGERMAVLLEERSGVFMRAATWIVARRTNPGMSLIDAGHTWVKLGG